VGTRIFSGLVLGLLAIVFIAHGGMVLFVLVLLLGLLALNEFYRMMWPYRPLTLAGFLGLPLLLWAAWFRGPGDMLAMIAVTLLLVFLLALTVGPKPGVVVRLAMTMLGVVYIGLGLGHLLLMRRLDHGTALVLTVVFGTWGGDTMAYFTGHYFGSTLMTPRLSPRKTWEGFAGGTIGTILLVVLISIYTSLGAGQSLLLGVVIAVVGPIGDLFESLLKRDVHVKDAGRAFPGHGGILDRFDALLFAMVASYYLITLVFNYGLP